MIWLDVEDYCQECCDFDPIKDSVTMYAGDVQKSYDTRVQCKYKDRCAQIAEMIKKRESEQDGSSMPKMRRESR